MDLREQADVGYSTLIVSKHDWDLWQKEIKEEVSRLPSYKVAFHKRNETQFTVGEELALPRLDKAI